MRLTGDSIHVLWENVADLVFHARQPDESKIETVEANQSIHIWKIVGMSFDVRGIVRGETFEGTGRHDHLFGTGPIPPSVIQSLGY